MKASTMDRDGTGRSRHRILGGLVMLLCVAAFAPLRAQAPQSPTTGAVPRLVPVAGIFTPADGQRALGVETVTFSIYTEETGGAPIWYETQNVAIDETGRYSALLGATTADGVPLEIFASGEARWLDIRFERAGEVDALRVRLTSVPYALRAADAETLGGHPASAYMRAPTGSDVATSSDPTSPNVGPRATLPATNNEVAKYSGTIDIVGAGMYASNGNLGVGTGSGISVGPGAPADRINALFTNTDGSITGLSVRNQGLGAGAFAGQLIYDQTNAVAFFQGFNNGTREFRQNNVSTAAGVPNGTINFMIGSQPALFVSSGRNVGIGTTTPGGPLHVMQGGASKFLVASDGAVGINTAAPQVPFHVVTSGTWLDASFTTYGPGSASFFDIEKARGTQSAPLPVGSDDNLLSIGAKGFNGAGFERAGAIEVFAAENFSIFGGHGSYMRFRTTQVGFTGLAERMRITDVGNVGINTTTPLDRLHVHGEVRVLNCVKNDAGTGIAGVCPSDRRLKRDITSFSAVLQSVAALRPVHYYWRATEFPERHFGDGRTYGLIAQEVEEVLPELVVTNPDGYKAVDYGKLPLLTVQAIKELKAENDALQSRIAELERLVKQFLAKR